MKGFSILTAKPDLFTIVLDPKSFTWESFEGTPDADALFSFGTNHSWLGIRLGYCKDSDDMNGLLIKENVRACFAINSEGEACIDLADKVSSYNIVHQAGPLILKHGQLMPICDKEFKLYDLNIPKPRVVVGITKNNKVIVVYTKNKPLYQIRNMISNHCVEAMAVASGNQAYIRFKHPMYSPPNRVTKYDCVVGKTSNVGLQCIPK